MTLLEQARTFREAFKQESLDNISRYGYVKKKLWDLQLRLVDEESKELLDAADEVFADPENPGKREEVLKELSDLVYVCYQFAAAFNLDLDGAMERVYQSNMSKLDDNGEPIFRSDGKVLKGPNYIPPDLSDLVPEPTSNLYDTHGK